MAISFDAISSIENLGYDDGIIFAIELKKEVADPNNYYKEGWTDEGNWLRTKSIRFRATVFVVSEAGMAHYQKGVDRGKLKPFSDKVVDTIIWTFNIIFLEKYG